MVWYFYQEAHNILSFFIMLAAIEDHCLDSEIQGDKIPALSLFSLIIRNNAIKKSCFPSFTL